MTPFAVSIHRRLLLLVLGIVSVVWVLAGWKTYHDAQQEVAEVFDANLVQSARILTSLLAHEVEEESEVRRDVELIAREFSDSAAGDYPILKAMIRRYGAPDSDHLRLLVTSGGPGHRYESQFALLARYRDGAVLVKSPNAPPLAREVDGFSEQAMDGALWRTFSLTDADTGLTVQVAEHQAVRQKLLRQITASTLEPLLFALPLLALALWAAVGQGLRPLRRLTADLERREPDTLEPLVSSDSPVEVRPLVDALNRLFERVERSMQHERRFTADAAHELRTPLAALRAQAQVARREEDPQRRDAALGHIISGVDRATHLVEQLLTLARADARQQGDVLAGRVSLRETAAAVVAEIAPWALQQTCELSLQGASGEVRGDAVLLRILIRNLVDNAVRYSGAGSQVRVGILEARNHVVLSVDDSGPGIALDERETLQERFHRGDDITQSGTGLGLSIVRRIADLHGARVELGYADDGSGLSVKVIFPLG